PPGASYLGWAASHHVSPDNLLHDFHGPSRDFDDSRVDIRAGDWVFEHVTEAAIELQALVHQTAMQIRGQQFRPGCIGRRKIASQVTFNTMVYEDPQRGGFRIQLRQYKLRILEICNGLAECLALFDVSHRLFDGSLANGSGTNRLRDPLVAKFRHQHAEASAFLPKAIADRNPHIRVEYFARILRLKSKLLQIAATLEARRVGGNKDKADTSCPCFHVGLGGGHDQIGILPV